MTFYGDYGFGNQILAAQKRLFYYIFRKFLRFRSLLEKYFHVGHFTGKNGAATLVTPANENIPTQIIFVILVKYYNFGQELIFVLSKLEIYSPKKKKLLLFLKIVMFSATKLI